jgi:hypothetical protein
MFLKGQMLYFLFGIDIYSIRGERLDMKKKLIILTIGFILFASSLVWHGIRVSNERERERELRHKAIYALRMHFTVFDSERGSIRSVLSELEANRRHSDEEVQYTKIVFVHSAKEAAQFGEYVLVAWPQGNFQVGERGHMHGTQHIVDAINEGIHRVHPHVDFRDYGLSKNEVTIVDAVENWEIVDKLDRLYGGIW